jgi:hypothetical protein
MYAMNSSIHGWWEKVTLIYLGYAAKLVIEERHNQKRLRGAGCGCPYISMQGVYRSLGETELWKTWNEVKKGEQHSRNFSKLRKAADK